MGAGEPVGVLDDPLFADLDQELVATEGANVLGQLTLRDALLGVVLKDNENIVKATNCESYRPIVLK